MIKIPVYLRDMYDAKHLVQAASGCKKDVDLICGRYIVDAKSMLGVFSLPTFDSVELGVEEEDEEKLMPPIVPSLPMRMRVSPLTLNS